MPQSLIALIALLVGLLVGWLLSAARQGQARRADAETLATLKARLEELPRREADLAERDRRLAEAAAELAGLRASETRLATQLEEAGRRNVEQLQLLEDARKALGDAFARLSAEALKQNNAQFLQLAQTHLAQFQQGAQSDLEKRQKAIDELVKPLHEKLEGVNKSIQEIEKSRVDAYAGLREQVKGLADSQQKLQTETASLVTALRKPQMRGRWGEIQLKNVVEMAGMLDHCDFVEQASVDVADGKLRPDMIVRLPGGKTVVVDAKAPLSAYLDSLEMPDDESRELRLKDHARQVRDHMTKLSQKGYWDQFEAAPEFVIMFLPGETFFSAALQHDPLLIEYGVGQKVIVASPTTLISLLRAVHYGWQQEKLTENAAKISELGRELYERLATIGDYLVDVGKHLDRTVGAYNKAVGSLETRLLVTGRKLKELGVGTKDEIPQLDPVEKSPRELTIETEGEAPRAARTPALPEAATPAPAGQARLPLA